MRPTSRCLGKHVAIRAEAIGFVDVLHEPEPPAELVDVIGLLAIRELDETGASLERRPTTLVVHIAKIDPIGVGMIETLQLLRPAEKYWLCGCPKYSPLTLAVGYIAKLSVNVTP